MAKPYFSGDYGSALAQIDTRPNMQGAAAQAAMYQNLGQSLGQSIGGAIEKYGLNKEKQKKQQANIKSTVNFLDSLANQDPDNVERYEVMKAQLNDPETPLTTRDELATSGIKNLTLSQQMLQRKGLTDAQAQLNSLNAEISQFKIRDARTTSELNAANSELAKLKERISERVVFEQGGVEEVAKGQVGDIEDAREKVGQELTLVASEIAKIDRETELLGVPDPDKADLRAKYQAEAEKLMAEAAKFRAETETMSTLTGEDAESAPEQAPIRQIDVPAAAGGDIKGYAVDAVNSILGVFGEPGFKDRRDETTNLKSLSAQLMPSLTKQISASGSVYTQEDMKRILPQPGDSNPLMQSKLESLVPLLRSRLEEAKIVYPTARAGVMKSNAIRVMKTMPSIIAVLEESISQKNRRPVNEEADRILREAGL
tara:strand:- start:177 stop:1460 length:1284 start_codon:yes stop_codon:yes gene_type:complete